MIQGANGYIKVRLDIDLALVSRIIFSFFAAKGDAPILQKIHPADTDVIDGIVYIGLTQQETMQLYDASGGRIELEQQIDIGDQTAYKTCGKTLHICKSRATEIIDGNHPDYTLPDSIIDVETGDLIVIRGADGKDGHTPYIGENGNWYGWDDAVGGYVDTEVPASGGGTITAEGVGDTIKLTLTGLTVSSEGSTIIIK